LRVTAESADALAGHALAAEKYSGDRRARTTTSLRAAFSANSRKLSPPSRLAAFARTGT